MVRQGQDEQPQQSRRVLVGTAMTSYQKFKGAKWTVIVLKGGLAFGQVATLVVLLILSAIPRNGTRQLDASSACPRPELFEAWMAVNAVRLSVCWGVSLWVVLRARPTLAAVQLEEASLVEARARRATGYSDRQRPSAWPQGCSSSSSQGSLSTLGSASSGSATPISSPPDSSCSFLPPSLSISKASPSSSPASSSPTLINDVPSLSTDTHTASAAAALDRLAPRISSFLAILSLALFVTGNVLVFSPLPGQGRETCKDTSPLLWWGVMIVVGVGWFLLAQVVLIVGVVGIGGSAVMAMLRAIHLVAPVPVATPAREPPPPPLTQDALSTIRISHFGASDLQLDQDHSSCLVCLSDYTLGEALRVLPCLHCFHPECIDPWLMNSSGRCPGCNAAVSVKLCV